MQRIALYFIIVAYLSCATEVHELWKISNLVAHYNEHNRQDHALSFFDFLTLHYSTHSEHANAEEHTDQLPFKAHHISISWVNFCAVVPSFFVNSEYAFLNESNHPVPFYTGIISSEPERSIWQPPQVVA